VKTVIYKSLYIFVVTILLFLPFAASAENIDPDNDGSQYAWGENTGWINFAPTGGGVTINPVTGIFSGYAWGENIGWINFAPNGKPVKTSWTGVIPDISVSPTSYNFGDAVVGSSSAPQTFTISNIGTADLHISGMTLSDITNYSLNVNGGSSPCGSTTPTITPDSSCTVTVTFNPLSIGQKDASLTVTSDDPETPTLDVSLTGVGVMPPLTLVAPNGGEAIPSGSIYTIKWVAPSNAVKFNLMYSMNNGIAWKTIVNNVTGTSYNWTVPAPIANKNKCLVKVIGYDASGMKLGEDRSDKTFTIEVVKVTSPDGGETLKSGTTWPITWRTNGTIRPVAKVKLYYSINGGLWNPIATVKGNPGNYPFRVPLFMSSDTSKVKVVLRDASGKTVGIDMSDGFSTIVP
jgi:hypothetical protein